MKPVIKLSFILLLFLLLATGCVNTSNELGLQIIPPESFNIPISGTWEITDVLNQSTSTEDSLRQWLGKTAFFTKEYAMIADYFIKDVSYQVRRVNTEEYILYHYDAFPEGYSFPVKETEVISVTDNELFFCEILKEQEDKLVLKIYNDSFVLKKISPEVDEASIKQLLEKNILKSKIENQPQTDLQRSGVLIGLRQTLKENDTDTETHSYRTLWISAENKNLEPLLETEGIFFPRRKGFWKMEVNRISEGNRTEDLLVAYNILSKDMHPIKKENFELFHPYERKEEIYRKINFISNDYVSIEEKTYVTSEGNRFLQSQGLHVLVIDSLPNIRRVNISDLLGDAGLEAIKTGIQKVLDQRSEKIKYRLSQYSENYGLERRLGHWLLKGRVSFFEDGQLRISDYNINLIPPRELVFYDNLCIPWTTVKDRVPAAVDLYTSPNKDIALVITKEEIMVFAINGYYLQQEPLERIPLKEGEVVIMVEWATGQYVENWKRTLENHIKQGDDLN
ncbi:MAG: hypothetical protein GX066_08755 [Clostridiaceae bacterium]|nr:hypothetical protein [Clostridiaceae bacterium]